MACVGAETSDELRTLVRTADGYEVIARAGDPLSPPSSPCSLFEALIQLLDPWQRKQLGEAADSPQALVDALSLWASQRRERVADVLGMAPITPGFRPPVRLGDGRVGYPLSGRGRAAFVHCAGVCSGCFQTWMITHLKTSSTGREALG